MSTDANTYFPQQPDQQLDWVTDILARYREENNNELLQEVFEAYFYHQLQPEVQDYIYQQIQISNPVAYAYYDFQQTVKILELQQGQEVKEQLVLLEKRARKVVHLKRYAQIAALALVFLSLPFYFQISKSFQVENQGEELLTPKETTTSNPAVNPPSVVEKIETSVKAEGTVASVANESTNNQVWLDDIQSTESNEINSSLAQDEISSKTTSKIQKIDIGQRSNDGFQTIPVRIKQTIETQAIADQENLGTSNKIEAVLSENPTQNIQHSNSNKKEINTPEKEPSNRHQQIAKLPNREIFLQEKADNYKEMDPQPEIPKLPTMVVQGLLTDSETGDILPGVAIRAGKKIVETDDNGYYKIEVDPTKQLQFSMVGYEQEMCKPQIGAGIQVLNVMLASNVASLGTMIEVSNKYSSPLSDVFVSTEVVKRQQATANHFSNLEEAVAQAPGVSVLDGQISIREGTGFSVGGGSRIALLLDGVPANQMDTDLSTWDFIPIENLEQVDIIKGATSTLFGSSALNGTINVRTVSPKKTPVTRISTFATVYMPPKDGEKKWWGAENHEKEPFKAGYLFSHAHKIGKLDLVAGSALMYDRSFRKGDYNRFLRFNTKLGYQLTDRVKIGLNVNSQGGYKSKSFMWENAEKGAYQTANNSHVKDTVARVMVDPSISVKDRFDNLHHIITRYYFNSNKQSNEYSDNSYLSHSLLGEYQFQRDFTDIGVILTAGGNGTFSQSSTRMLNDSAFVASSFGGYLQMDKRFMKNRLNFSMGFRFEENKIESPWGIKEEARPVLRGGLNFRLTDNTFVRASWGQGYRFPTIAERYISSTFGGIVVYPNPKLQSEFGWSSELGIKQGFSKGRWNGFIDVSGFWQEYENMIEQVFAQYGNSSSPNLGLGFSPKNISNTTVRINGVELSMTTKGKFGKLPVEFSGGYTYSNPKYVYNDDFQFHQDSVDSTSPKNVLKYRHKHNLKLDMASNLKRFSFGFSGNYYSFMEAIDQVFETYEAWGIEDYRSQNSKGHFTLGARFAYHPNDQFKISIIGKNILNSEYTLRPGLLEAPANVSVRLTFAMK